MTEGLKTTSIIISDIPLSFCRVLWHYGELQNSIGIKGYFSILSPCVSVREYRGSARRARELKKILAEKETEADINLSPAVSRSVTGSYVSNIGETPKIR